MMCSAYTVMSASSPQFICVALALHLLFATPAETNATSDKAIAASDTLSNATASTLALDFVHAATDLLHGSFKQWNGATIGQDRRSIGSMHASSPKEFRVRSESQYVGYVLVGGLPGSPAVLEFADSGLPVGMQISFASLSLAKAHLKGDTMTSAVVRSIANVPDVAADDGPLSAIGGVLAFWAGRRAAYDALRTTRIQPVPTTSRADQNRWLESAVRRLNAAAGIKALTNTLSTDTATQESRVSFIEYRIEIDQGRPVLILLSCPQDGKKMVSSALMTCIGTGYVSNQFGDFLEVRIPEREDRRPSDRAALVSRQVFLNWTAVVDSIDIVTVKPERER